MPYRAEAFRAGAYYHLYNRGHNRQPIFLERENYLFFLRKLRHHLAAEALDVIAYCLMTNHYHLLVRLKHDDLSDAMHAFAVAYAKAINKRYQRVGGLFQGPFRAVLVDADEYLLHLSRYIHRNPVAAKLVASSEEWEFSSYREYLGQRAGTLPRPAVVLAQFPSPDGYRQFVESYAPPEKNRIAHLLLDDE